MPVANDSGSSDFTLHSFKYFSDLFIPGLIYFLLLQRGGFLPGAAAGSAEGLRQGINWCLWMCFYAMVGSALILSCVLRCPVWATFTDPSFCTLLTVFHTELLENFPSAFPFGMVCMVMC